MNNKYKNVCMRCGQERIIAHIRKEKIGTSVVTTTETVCPDKLCQRKVNAENKKYDEKRRAMRLRTSQRQRQSIQIK